MYKQYIKAGILAVLAVALCISCQNKPVTISRDNVSINILTTEVLSPFTPYVPADMEMYEENGIASKIKIEAFAYDDSGSLVHSFSQFIDNYDEGRLSFPLSITGANPTLVCFSYAVWTDTDGTEYPAYEISGEEHCSTLKIQTSYAFEIISIPWQVLGFCQAVIGAENEINVVLKPHGGLVYLSWDNIHAHDSETPAPQRYTLAIKDNTIMKCNDFNWEYSTTLASSYYHISHCYPEYNLEYDGLYNMRFFLPGPSKAFGYSCHSPSGFQEDDEVRIYETSEVDTDIQAGKQYVLSLDCTDYDLRYSEGILEF